MNTPLPGAATPRKTRPSRVWPGEAARRGMPNLNRRGFLTGFSAALFLPPAVATAVKRQRYLFGAAPQAAAPTAAAALQPTSLRLGRIKTVLPPPPVSARIALPGPGVLSVLPGDGDLLALTVDDGVSTDVVRLYTQFAKDTGIRLTYFVNGTYRSWTDNAALLRPLVDSGQIQLGNHTWSHPDLTTLSAGRIGDEITRNDTFLKNTFGVDARPYLRPPYGKHNAALGR